MLGQIKLEHETTEQFAFKPEPSGKDTIAIKPLDLKSFRTEFNVTTGEKEVEDGQYSLADGSVSERWNTNFKLGNWHKSKTWRLPSPCHS